MSSIEPSDGCGEVDRGQEIAGGFVVTCGDGPILLEPCEEVLNQVARLEKVAVIGAGGFAIASRWNDGRLSRRGERFQYALVGIEGFVGDEGAGLHAGQELISAGQIMGFATRQDEADRVAQRVDQGMDFGAQSTAGTADRLVLSGFFWAPALY